MVHLSIWAAAFATALAVLYGLDYPRMLGTGTYYPLSPAATAMYGGMHRLAWGLCIAWVIFACSRGYGGERRWSGSVQTSCVAQMVERERCDVLSPRRRVDQPVPELGGLPAAVEADLPHLPDPPDRLARLWVLGPERGQHEPLHRGEPRQVFFQSWDKD